MNDLRAINPYCIVLVESGYLANPVVGDLDTYKIPLSAKQQSIRSVATMLVQGQHLLMVFDSYSDNVNNR